MLFGRLRQLSIPTFKRIDGFAEVAAFQQAHREMGKATRLPESCRGEMIDGRRRSRLAIRRSLIR
jgi:hypothetical protein